MSAPTTAIVSFVPDIEDILVQAIRDNLNGDISWQELYPVYGNVRVSLTHPFVELLDQSVQGVQTQSELFPSITLASLSDSTLPGMAVTWDENPIETADLAEIQASDGYLIPASQLTALQTFLASAPVGVISRSTSVIRTHNMALEIWADNLTIKNKLYDLLAMALSGKIRLDLKPTGITIKLEDLKGQRSGHYNMDFGKLYYGAVLNFPVDVSYWQLFVDVTQTAITDAQVALIEG